ncbi:MAG: hypothetical protein JNG88_08465 [Phycisphaerales bacterium]|nr:hypothetical protein [Phycisphaerales bacterium]
MMRSSLIASLVYGIVGALPLCFAEILVRYDADVFPEEQGWERWLFDPDGAEVRELSDSTLRLDTRASELISDTYNFYLGNVEPSERNPLRISWRMQTLEDHGDLLLTDVVLFLAAPTSQAIEFIIGTDTVTEGLDRGGRVLHEYAIDSGMAHDYEILTANFQTYSFWVDGEFAFTGEFRGSAWGQVPRIAFGDAIVGTYSSLSAWDFVEAALVPEPHACLLLGTLLLWRCR